VIPGNDQKRTALIAGLIGGIGGTGLIAAAASALAYFKLKKADASLTTPVEMNNM